MPNSSAILFFLPPAETRTEIPTAHTHYTCLFQSERQKGILPPSAVFTQHQKLSPHIQVNCHILGG